MSLTPPAGQQPAPVFSYRPYFYPDGVMLMKLTVKRGNEFVLVSERVPRPGKRPRVYHYEEHVKLDNPEAVVAAILRAQNGTLGGYNPQSQAA